MDPLSNMLSQIKNAAHAGKETVVIPYSNFSFAVAEALLREGYFSAVNKKGQKWKGVIEVKLAYENASPKLRDIKRLSKLSRRYYLGARSIFPVRQGKGRIILSTPKGVLSGEEARKQKVGGEALFEIW